MPDEMPIGQNQPAITPTTSLPFSKKRFALALAIAAISDAMGAVVTLAHVYHFRGGCP